MSDRAIYLRVDQVRRLDHWCESLRASFCAPVYLVGSVLERESWRDVDVRVCMADAKILALPMNRHDLDMLLSRWGQQQTDLPIDCQVQSYTESQEHTGQRNPRGLMR